MAQDPSQTSSLMGLFAPPTSANQNQDNGEDREAVTNAPVRVTTASDKPQSSPSKSIPIPNSQDTTNASYDATSPSRGSSSPPSGTLSTSPYDSYWESKDSQNNGTTSHLMSLFAAGPKSPITPQRPPMERQSTAPRSNLLTDDSQESTPLMGDLSSSIPVYSLDAASNSFKSNPSPAKSGEKPTHQSNPSIVPMKRVSATGTMPSIQEGVAQSISDSKSHSDKNKKGTCLRILSTIANEATKGTTIIGSFMYLLYHIVFCLALGSAIIRPHNPTSILGLMCKMAALGSIASSCIYWLTLGTEVPALYPTVDLFLAPFLAHLAVIVDQTLANDPNVSKEENDTIFLGTFAILSAIGICFSGLLLLLSSVFRLANLGSFLPFPVICGFFAAVGILTWTLAVAVDTGGKSIGTILSSGDMGLVGYALLHHIPGVMIAAVMKYMGPRNPFYVIMIVICSVGVFYLVMFSMGVSLEEAKDNGWFWSHEELVYDNTKTIGFFAWAPPAPFGSLNLLVHGKIHWGAISNGLSTAIAMGFLYVIRCSVHATALKKNIANLSRRAKANDKTLANIFASPKPPMRPKPLNSRTFSEAVDIESVMNTPNTPHDDTHTVIKAKPTTITLNHILLPYGYNQFLAALVGGFPITPSVAASSTMFTLGAEGLAPQIGSVLLLLIFYLTDFQLVGYIPKPAFSSMLVLAFIDMIYTWFYKSYFKTKDKLEWLVVPIIVVAAFVLDLLAAVFLGIAISTFLFVASFFRSGVVKYAANGITIHSTIERPFGSSEWLDKNGDLIQVLVIQNYLFFGNATSVYNYIEALFQSDDNRRPQFMILDMTLVTGMDTSTVDIFNDIKNLCTSNSCKLFMAGIPSRIRVIFGLGGFKADTTGERSKRHLRFFASLDAALGKAEDILLAAKFEQEENYVPYGHRRLLSEGDNGLRSALRHIDEQHDENFAVALLPLQKFTRPIELQSGDRLYDYTDSLGDIERGLFFIESGVIKIEHSTDATLTRGGTKRGGTFNGSIGALDPINRLSTPLDTSQNFRLARIGPGWVAGTMEYVSGIRYAGDHVAITDCRLHHLPYSRLQEIEKENPSLVLALYKLLSFLMARRQEATIGQLATLHSIMTSPPKGRPLRKRA